MHLANLTPGTAVKVIRDGVESRTASVVRSVQIPAIPDSPLYPGREATTLIRLGDDCWYDTSTGAQHPCASSTIRPVNYSNAD